MLGTIVIVISISGSQLALSDQGKQNPWTPDVICDFMSRDESEDSQRVISVCTDSLRINPAGHRSLVARAGAYFHDKMYDAAIADLTTDLKAKPTAEAYQLRALCYKWLNKYQLALSDLNSALVINPEDSFALGIRGNVLDRLGDSNRAIEDLSRSLEIDGKSAFMLTNRAYVYLHLKRYSESIKDFSDSIERSHAAGGNLSELEFALIGRCRSYRYVQKFSESIADCSEAIRLNPQIADAYASRGVTERKKKDLDAALSDEGEAIRLDPMYSFPLETRALIYSDMGKYDPALSDINAAARLSPTDATIFANRGYILSEVGAFTLARDSFSEAIELNPDDGIARSDRCFVGAVLGHDLASALSDCNRAISIEPDHATFYTNRALVSVKNGNFEQSVMDCETAMKLGLTKDSDRAATLYVESVAHKRLGQIMKSDSEAALAVSIDPTVAQRVATYGVVP